MESRQRVITIRTTILYAVFKGTVLGGTAAWVIGNAALSTTIRSIIVAFISGGLGVIGVGLGAYLNNHWNNQGVRRNEEVLNEIKQLQQYYGKEAMLQAKLLGDLKELQEYQASKVDEISSRAPRRRTDDSSVDYRSDRERFTGGDC